VPYRDFSVEYPPAALPVFVLPTWLGHPRRYFEWLMAACGVATVLVVAAALRRLGAGGARSTAALALVGLSPLLVGSVILTRFDLWPTLLVAGALAALLSGRDLAGGALLGLAIAAKLFPAVLVPLGIAWAWRRRGRRFALAWTGVVAGVVLACFLPFLVLAPGGVAHSFGTQLGRPLQIESLGASLLIAAHHLFGLGLHLDSTHGSQNLTGTGPDVVSAVSTALQAVALAATWILFARGPATRVRLVVAAAASVAAFIGLGKVFSPQFLIWLVPLVPLVPRRAAWALFAGALVLTQTWIPHHYWALALDFAQPESWLLLARNLWVVALLLLLQHELRAEARPAREPLQAVGAEV
jgi:uncharacterized membrane protein